jgi:hypothetical protein
MHLTYRDPLAHTGVVSDASATEAGAPEIEVTPAMIAAGRECIASVWLDFTGPNGHREWGPVLTRVSSSAIGFSR